MLNRGAANLHHEDDLIQDDLSQEEEFDEPSNFQVKTFLKI